MQAVPGEHVHLESKVERKVQKHQLCCFSDLCMHWFILVCAPTGDQTGNHGIWCYRPGAHPWPGLPGASGSVWVLGLV